jgi:DNA-binding NtrC family response regulator
MIRTLLGPEVEFLEAQVQDPTSFAQVQSVQEQALGTASAVEGEGTQMWIHLTSGTPAMAAVFVLLGATLYPARFLQSYRGTVREESVNFDLLRDGIPKVLESQSRALQDDAPIDEVASGFDRIIAEAPVMQAMIRRASRVALYDVNSLITGESGSGKELVARAIHESSPRRDGPFEVVNCATIPRELQASILFGHERGAFTGATSRQQGAFECANGGTLFLDEFGELQLEVQAALLRVLQPNAAKPLTERVYRPLGATKDRVASVRVIAATNTDCDHAIQERRLRADLYHRVATTRIEVPPLRERLSDIPLLAKHALKEAIQVIGPQARNYTISDAISAALQSKTWKGNVRELRNSVISAAIFSDGPQLAPADFESRSSDEGKEVRELPQLNEGGLRAKLRDIEAAYIRAAAISTSGRKSSAARALGLPNYQALDSRCRALGLDWDELTAS